MCLKKVSSSTETCWRLLRVHVLLKWAGIVYRRNNFGDHALAKICHVTRFPNEEEPTHLSSEAHRQLMNTLREYITR